MGRTAMASVAEKTYTYKELIDLYIRLPSYKSFHPDFDSYYTGLGSALGRIFEIDMFEGEVQKNPKFHKSDLWVLSRLFDDIVFHLRFGGIGGHYLEGGPIFTLMDLAKENPEREISVKTFWDVQEQEKALYAIYKSLLYQLFDIFYGKTDLAFTSKDLLALGFDDSKEPNISDYNEEI
jgi:hypothetical protein